MMKLRHAATGALLAALATFAHAEHTICTVVADAATGKVVLHEGRCDERVTPASTFKLALAVMGYDHGFLKNPHAPVEHIKRGDPDWGGEAWRQPVDPTLWLQYSVVWYSQRITHAMGAQAFQAYVRKLDYGNMDVSGDPGKNNGLDRSWITSSLKISPQEQVGFLRRLVNRQLPVSAQTYEKVERTVQSWQVPGGWAVQGKTGMAGPAPGNTSPDGTWDQAHAYGWFVGWAKKGTGADSRTYVFANLIQDDKVEPTSTGVRSRDAMLARLPEVLAFAGH
ncbi:OXA-22 family class D beta-lactamase [Ralstonia soli]|uniref:OXA-22 family class D beta-lactamase n=1 Tax=Ralstonia soli TaxID=2953896 RepID=A0ABT1AQW7_9RALS|nr:OXA-22 family class D beta-lactamase [Ralstonia soli]MCO5400614.1 OXA-22 family class D beta-lactamase [Ralstonia soli]